MTPFDSQEQIHEFVGETRARLKGLESGQKDLWDALVQSRSDSAKAHAELRQTVDALREELHTRSEQFGEDLAVVRTRVALGVTILSIAGSCIAGLIVKLA